MRTTRLIPLLAIVLLFSSAVAGRVGGKAFQETSSRSETGKKFRTLKPGRYLFRLMVEQSDRALQIVRIEKAEGALSVKFLENPITIDGEAEIGLEIVRKRWRIDGQNKRFTELAFKIGDDGSLSGMVECTLLNPRTGTEQPPVSLELVGKVTDDTHATGTWVARTINDSAADSLLATNRWSLESIESELAAMEADPKPLIRRRNMAAAEQMMRSINTGQAVFESGIGKGQYSDELRRLGGGAQDDEVGLIDDAIVRAQFLPRYGYLLGPLVRRLKDDAKGISAGYSITCYPAVSSGDDRTGDDCYYVDETGVIRHSGAPDIPAGPDSPPIGN